MTVFSQGIQTLFDNGQAQTRPANIPRQPAPPVDTSLPDDSKPEDSTQAANNESSKPPPNFFSVLNEMTIFQQLINIAFRPGASLVSPIVVAEVLEKLDKCGKNQPSELLSAYQILSSYHKYCLRDSTKQLLCDTTLQVLKERALVVGAVVQLFHPDLGIPAFQVDVFSFQHDICGHIKRYAEKVEEHHLDSQGLVWKDVERALMEVMSEQRSQKQKARETKELAPKDEVIRLQDVSMNQETNSKAFAQEVPNSQPGQLSQIYFWLFMIFMGWLYWTAITKDPREQYMESNGWISGMLFGRLVAFVMFTAEKLVYAAVF
ncbi:hypothetical protein RhiLY_06211 [Ceratobasidium sp. AG-Ba]|nr:hypothetical protein RhiLY_06211 [Ceratobasidium sp. AG-Ba]